MTALLLLGGLVFLIAGAEGLVRGASQLAERAGISPLIIGLTVVAFGTSAPELAVSIGSSVSGQGDLALGNVVGSNVFNVLLILGLSALTAPLAVSSQLVRFDVPLMIGASVLVLGLAANGSLGRLDGAVLFSGILAYTVYQIVQGRKAAPSPAPPSGSQQASAPSPSDGSPPEASASADDSTKPTSALRAVLLALGGLGALVLGARWLVAGAVDVASAFGLSELVIGLTIVAGGTSLPELATSVMASIRGERDIAVGNVVGSNVFNLLGVLGASALLAPDGIPVAPGVFWIDLPVMLGVAVICLPMFFTGQQVSRGEGAAFIAFYVAYTAYLLLTASEHASLSAFKTAMVGFVLPITAVVLIASAYREWHRRQELGHRPES